jgi:hypothetical protein
MESVYHIVTIHVNETSWAHVWRLRSRYLRTGYDAILEALGIQFPNIDAVMSDEERRSSLASTTAGGGRPHEDL